MKALLLLAALMLSLSVPLSTEKKRTPAVLRKNFTAEEYKLIEEGYAAIARGDELHAQGKKAEVVKEWRRARIIFERVLGPEDSETLAIRNNLALALEDQGKQAEAEKEYRATLLISERVLGPQHPDVLHTLYNLATCLERWGKLPEALVVFKRAEERYQKTGGPEATDAMGFKAGRERIEAELKKQQAGGKQPK